MAEDQVDLLIAEFLQEAAAGKEPDREELLAQHPELAGELRSFFADHDRMRVLAQPPQAETIGLNGAVAPATTVRYFGDYEILGEVARGGMGVVYRARQVSLNRIVALKMILSGQLAAPADIQRFHAEAEAAANLDHPNIVPIYEVGEYQGQHYFSMKLIEGGSLAETLAGRAGVGAGKEEQRQAARLLATVAKAVHHAHQHGVIHRDLKPANVLLDGQGQPHVSDFGLARQVRCEGGPTVTGSIVGTPAYMAPEQARAEKGLTTVADVYSLGAILYELLTGRAPFVGPMPMDVLTQVLDKEPRRPRALNPGLDRDLETICLKCLAKDPARRYSSAEALADDLDRWLRREPIMARPAGYTERAVKGARRRPALAALMAVCVLATAGLVGGGIWFTGQLRDERDIAQQERDIAQQERNNAAERAEAEAEAKRKALVAEQGAREAQGRAEQEKARTERQLLRAEMARYAIQIGLAQREWQENNLFRAREILGECRVDLRGWEYDYLQSLCQQRMRSFQGDRGGVNSVAFSPDGKRLATAGMGWGIPGKHGQVKVWDVATGRETLALKPNAGAVTCVAFSPDGKRIASGTSANPHKSGKPEQVTVWELSTGQEVFTLKGHSDGIASVAFSPDGKRLASASSDRTVRVWNTANGQNVFTLKGHTKAVLSVAFSPDGKHLASGSLDGTVKLWDVATGREVLALKGHPQGATSVAFSPDGKHLASGSLDGTVKLWDVATGLEVLTLKGHNRGVMSVAFSPDGKHLANGSSEGTVKLWDVATAREVLTLKGLTGIVSSVAFSADGKHLASGSFDSTVNVWNLDMNESHTLKGHTAMVTSVAFSPDSKWLASASLDRSVKVWNVHTGEGAFTLSGQMVSASVAFSPDGKRLASGGAENGKAGAIEVWDLQTRRPALTLKGHREGVVSVAFSPDGQRLVSASLAYGPVRGALKLWDLQTGREALPLRGHVGENTSVAYSPDGKRLASAGGGFFSQEVKVWDAATGKEVLTLRKRIDPAFQRASVITSVCFSPDGRHLASARRGPGIVIGKSPPGDITIWDLRTGQEVLTLKGHTGDVLSVVFHPDGRRLATASDDTTVKVWDATTGQEVLTLKGHTGQVWKVAFSPDGKRLASASYDGTVRVWTGAGRVRQVNR